MHIRYLVFVCAIGAVLMASAPRSQADIRPPANGRSARNWLQIPFIPDPGGYTSPDGRYLAEAVGGDGEPGTLDIYAIKKRHGHPFKQRVFSGLQDWNTFTWIPHRPHTLVAATGGIDYGVGVLALWDGRLPGRPLSAAHRRAWSGLRAWWDPRLERLRRARQEDGEGFQLVAVSADGNAIRYKHGGFGDDGIAGVVHTLRLPPR